MTWNVTRFGNQSTYPGQLISKNCLCFSVQINNIMTIKLLDLSFFRAMKHPQLFTKKFNAKIIMKIISISAKITCWLVQLFIYQVVGYTQKPSLRRSRNDVFPSKLQLCARLSIPLALPHVLLVPNLDSPQQYLVRLTNLK